MEILKISLTNPLKCISVLLATIFFGCHNNHNSKNEARPNVNVILADDMGFSDLGCYGSETQTPNLEKLASEGLSMTQF